MKQIKASQTLARLKRQLKDAGIKQEQVAARAGVTLPHVCNILAGRGKSQPVVDAARALLAEAKDRNGVMQAEAQHTSVPA